MIVGTSLHFNCWLLLPHVSPSFSTFICPCVLSLIFFRLAFLPCLSLTSVMLLIGFLTWIKQPLTCIIFISLTVEIHWAHFLMMMRKMMFGELFGQISFFRFPKSVIMSLANSIFYSIKVYIYSFGAFFLYFVVNNSIYFVADNSISFGVVCLHVCGRW